MDSVLKSLIEEYDKCYGKINNLDSSEEMYQERFERILHYANGIKFAINLIKKE